MLVSSVTSWLLSILFWIGLGLAAVLMGTLVLAPRWFRSEQLQLRYEKNARILSNLEHETAHLSRVAGALKTDPDYVARVASSELGTLPAGGVRIPLDASLGYDSRIPANQAPTAIATPWYLPLLEAVATSAAVRIRLGAATAILMLLTFFCFNESFFNGGLRGVLRFFSSLLGVRYAIDSDQNLV